MHPCLILVFLQSLQQPYCMLVAKSDIKTTPIQHTDCTVSNAHVLVKNFLIALTSLSRLNFTNNMKFIYYNRIHIWLTVQILPFVMPLIWLPSFITDYITWTMFRFQINLANIFPNNSKRK